uniref:Vacuolar protein sorting-associated protein 32 homolog 2-like n=1 Tax=Rhizophora mucronata TaxID=61149 RepID=A0A2P2LU36_RHIMU
MFNRDIHRILCTTSLIEFYVVFVRCIHEALSPIYVAFVLVSFHSNLCCFLCLFLFGSD